MTASDVRPPSDTGTTGCDHPGLDHGVWWSYCWPCPACGVCRFIGHGPLCCPCYDLAALAGQGQP